LGAADIWKIPAAIIKDRYAARHNLRLILCLIKGKVCFSDTVNIVRALAVDWEMYAKR
jgi:hypothetical protein